MELGRCIVFVFLHPTSLGLGLDVPVLVVVVWMMLLNQRIVVLRSMLLLSSIVILSMIRHAGSLILKEDSVGGVPGPYLSQITVTNVTSITQITIILSAIGTDQRNKNFV